MFRFPVINNIRLFSLQRWTSFRTRVREKHSAHHDEQSLVQLNSGNNWFSPQQSPAIDSSEPVWNTEQPLKEITSFDDFGVLSFGRSSSNDTLSTVGEKSFLDHLLKSGSSSYVTGSGTIPTVVDSVELGGCSESFDQLEVLLSEGFDVSAVMQGLAESGTSFGAQSVCIGSSDGLPVKEERTDVDDDCDSDLPYLIPNVSRAVRPPANFIPSENSSTRKMLSDTDRMVRRTPIDTPSSSPMSSASLSPTATLSKPSFKEAEVPQYVAHVPSTSVAPPTRFDPSTDRFQTAHIEDVLDIIDAQDICSLCTLLTQKKWPDLREMGPHISPLFRLVIDKAEDVEEALMFFRDFAASSPRAFVRDDLVVSLAIRAAKENGKTAASDILRLFRNMFLAKAPGFKSFRVRASLEELYEVVCIGEHGALEKSQEIVDAVLDCQYDTDSRSFLRVLTSHLASNDKSFDDIFRIWCKLSVKYGQTAGVDLIWDAALAQRDDSAKRAKCVGAVLKHCSMFDHPFDSIAEMICSLIRLDCMNEAQAVFSKVSVSGRHFRRPLVRFKDNENGLVYSERLAVLVTSCMFGERRRGRKNKTVPNAEAEEEFTLSKEFSTTLDTFLGIGGRKTVQSSYAKKNDKRKLHRVDEEQLHELAGNLQALWFKLAVASNDIASIDRMLEWSQKNRIEIGTDMTKRIESLKSIGAEL